MIRSFAWSTSVLAILALSVALSSIGCGRGEEISVSDEDLGFVTETVALQVEGMT